MKTIFPLSLLMASVTFAFGQNVNQTAVDTLTKDVAIAVFASIDQPKAQEIYAQLLACGDGCDPQTIIHSVGEWDAVGAKMEELGLLKNTARFIAMSPAEANAAIRQQLAQFYARYKSNQHYGKPLSPAVQSRILDKIDAMLPPASAPMPSAPAAGTTLNGDTVSGDQTDINPVALQLSQLERRAKEAEENKFWMIIAGILGGLVVGAGAVYLLLYRSAQAEMKRLLVENDRLSRSLDVARQSKPANEPRPQSDYQKKASAYDAIQAELGAGTDPLTAIRSLKQRAAAPAAEPIMPPIRSGEPTVEPVATPGPVSMPAQPTIDTGHPPHPAVSPARSEVFYFPPPDPSGQFDIGQKSGTLSPESAYRFSVSADKPSVASFRFEAEPGRVARFLTYRNYMIEPACESENTYTPTHTRIAVRRDGDAVLDNGLWRVKTKALIRYE